MTPKAGIAEAVILINVVMFVIVGIDKRRASRNEFRVSEKILLMGGFFGGAGGVLSAMVAFRHKTQKKIFRIGMPILFFLNLAGAYAALVFKL
jgi:uncharacterized membrane protein YsdA (DUF1294 family)